MLNNLMRMPGEQDIIAGMMLRRLTSVDKPIVIGDISLFKKQAELALCVALRNNKPSSLDATRVGGLTENIAKLALRELDWLGDIEMKRARKIEARIRKFEIMSGWGIGKEKHVGTYINTLLMILDKRPYPKIKNLLVEIIDFYERDGMKIAKACFWAAEVNMEKWDECFS